MKSSFIIYFIIGIINLFLYPSIISADNSFKNSLNDNKKILFLGDSLTAGYGLEVAKSFPSLISNKIKESNLNYSVINAGISGDTTAGGFGRINWLLNQDVSIVVLALGANDAFRGFKTEVTRTNLLKIIEAIKKKDPNIKILLAGMLAPPNMGTVFGSAYKELFSQIAKENNLEYIPFLLEGVASDPSLNLEDGIHPNEKGYEVIAEIVWQKLKPML